MLHLQLIAGAPDEPDEDDLDAVCDGPSPQRFFETLFAEVANFRLPAPVITAEYDESDVRRIRIGWRGTQALGLEITEIECSETTALPMYVHCETHGLPGMTVVWHHTLHYKGQLGYVVFRNGKVECTFEGDGDRHRFATVWRRIVGKDPVFETVSTPAS